MSADDETGQQILAPYPARFIVTIYLPAVVLFSILRLALLLRFKPLMRNQRRNEFLIQLAAVDDVTSIDAVGEERIVAIGVLEQARRLVNFAIVSTPV